MDSLKLDMDNGFFFNSSDNIKKEFLEFPKHYHSLFEIYYMKNGSCRYFIDNNSYLVESGDIVLIPSGIIHNTQYSDSSYSRYLVNCSKYFIPNSVLKSISNFKYVYYNENIKLKVEEIFSEIKHDYEKRDAFSKESLQSLLYSLFILLARNPNQKVNTIFNNVYVSKMIEYIKANFSSNISLAGVAEECSVSREHLSRTFKQETGYCFSEYLTLVRLKHAEYLLKNDNLSIIETANRCGFGDSNYFSFVFKKNYGVSPSKFKETL